MKPKAKIYLASRHSRKSQLLQYTRELRERGFEITSRWLFVEHQVDDEGLSAQADPEERERFAKEDWDDVMAADLLFSVTEAPRTTKTRGGRHVEFGAAYAAGKPCVVLGPRENVFHCLPGVVVFETWEEALIFLEVNYRTFGGEKNPYPETNIKGLILDLQASSYDARMDEIANRETVAPSATTSAESFEDGWRSAILWAAEFLRKHV